MNLERTNARVWIFEDEPKKGAKVFNAKITTYEGEDQNGEPKYSTWYARFVGEAFSHAKKFEDGDKFCIESGKIEAYYDKKKKQNYVTVTVFEVGDPIEPKKKK